MPREAESGQTWCRSTLTGNVLVWSVRLAALPEPRARTLALVCVGLVPLIMLPARPMLDAQSTIELNFKI
jgi:hypothetical protein